MNKRRNKSITKTQHRVQKTKKSRRLNKNRSVKGIRGNNKTKVVGKRRNIVQRGGGDINDLVGRIYGLDRIQTEDEKTAEIESILSEIEPSNFLQVARDLKQPSDTTATGPTLLYAACRLQNPRIDLVRRILEKMKIHNDSKFSIKVFTVKPRGVRDMYSIIPNGSANGSYPQHAAVQAIKDILDGLSKSKSQSILFIDDTNKTRILNIFTILQMLKMYDDELAEHINRGKNVISPPEFKEEDINTPLMNKTNHLPNGLNLTAYEEFSISFGGKPSIRDILARIPQQGGHQIHTFRTEEFDKVLAPTGPVSVAAGSAGAASPLPLGWEEFIDHQTGRPYYFNKDVGKTQWERPVISSKIPRMIETRWDPDSRRPFTINHNTLTTIWASFEPQPWERRFDAQIKKEFYYNLITKELSWTLPQNIDSAPPKYSEVMANLKKYPLYDTEFGRTYYIDPATADRVWV